MNLFENLQTYNESTEESDNENIPMDVEVYMDDEDSEWEKYKCPNCGYILQEWAIGGNYNYMEQQEYCPQCGVTLNWNHFNEE